MLRSRWLQERRREGGRIVSCMTRAGKIVLFGDGVKVYVALIRILV